MAGACIGRQGISVARKTRSHSRPSLYRERWVCTRDERETSRRARRTHGWIDGGGADQRMDGETSRACARDS
eukprot:766514-Pleurochrysis_carterae.AAC.1